MFVFWFRHSGQASLRPSHVHATSRSPGLAPHRPTSAHFPRQFMQSSCRQTCRHPPSVLARESKHLYAQKQKRPKSPNTRPAPPTAPFDFAREPIEPSLRECPDCSRQGAVEQHSVACVLDPITRHHGFEHWRSPANLQPSFTCPHSPPVQTFPRADASRAAENRGGPTRPAQGADAKEKI